MRIAATILFVTNLAAAGAGAAESFTTFESGQVRPLAVSDDGTRLVAVNTPDARLEVFDLNAEFPEHVGSVPVGLEPVAVALRGGQAWVVNHLSDSISIVDLAASPPRVVRTLLVGDEPRDIVFAGPDHGRAFITAAHRGQNRPGDPQLTTPGIGRADVWVFDADEPGAALGGTPLTILTLFTDTPRALAATPDGRTVYAAGFHSGNQTTALSEGVVCNGGSNVGACNVFGSIMPGGLPGPNTNFEGRRAPEVGLIVRFDNERQEWRDTLGRNWNNGVRFNLPDRDVFEIDAMADPPVARRDFRHVGTVLFNMAVHPGSGRVYVSNTEAPNEVRFEGPGIFGGSTVRGHLHEARISVVDPMTAALSITPLNPHIDYGVVPSPPGVKERSLATPLGMTFDPSGETLFVAAFGSSKIGTLRVSDVDAGTIVPGPDTQIPVLGGGPTGLVHDPERPLLYVLTRFDNALAVIDTSERREVAHLPLYNPEPEEVVLGRPFLYDAAHTSSNGEASCSACHVFADFDSLAWDLGNPDDVVVANRNPNRLPLGDRTFHPMKGPMTTQTLRGMATHGPMHWRGDRTGSSVPGGSALNERMAFKEFNVAFEGLLGRTEELTEAEMQAFTDFILAVQLPPNPIRRLDNSLTPDQQAGRNHYFGPVTDQVFNCNGCHVLNPASGFFGTDGFTTFENEPQMFKIAHLRNMYQKVGMFGMPAVGFFSSGDNSHMGDQVRGFGFLHDGSTDTLFRFLHASVFNFAGGDRTRRELEAFVLAFDTNFAPIVGQQVTMGPDSDAESNQRVDLLVQRAAAGECDLVVKGVEGGQDRGWARRNDGFMQPDRASEPALLEATLRILAEADGNSLTYTCMPPGSGVRAGIDRDEDGYFDRDEIDAGSNPADPRSVPGDETPTPTVSPTPTPTVPPGGCTGDCDGDGTVSVDELIVGVRIALGEAAVDECTAADANGDGIVSVDELVSGVGTALEGCGD